MNRGLGKQLADGVRPLHLARFDQLCDHCGGDALGDPSQVPAIADLDPHVAPLLPLAVGCGSYDFSVDHHHRGEADEILFFTKVDDRTRERGRGVIIVNRAAGRLLALAAITLLGRQPDGLTVGPGHGDVFERLRRWRPERRDDELDGIFWLVSHAGQDFDQVLLESLPPFAVVGAPAVRQDFSGRDAVERDELEPILADFDLGLGSLPAHGGEGRFLGMIVVRVGIDAGHANQQERHRAQATDE